MSKTLPYSSSPNISVPPVKVDIEHPVVVEEVAPEMNRAIHGSQMESVAESVEEPVEEKKSIKKKA